MKPLLVFIAVLMAPVAWLATEKLIERHDDTAEYIVNIPNQLRTKQSNGEYIPHVGPYQVKGKLTYDIERIATRTVTAKTTRRIVQKTVSASGISRTPIYIYPSPPTGSRVDANPPGIESVVTHVTIDLPDKDVLPPGKGYIIESSVEFPAHGEKDARTYISESAPFDVE